MSNDRARGNHTPGKISISKKILFIILFIKVLKEIIKSILKILIYLFKKNNDINIIKRSSFWNEKWYKENYNLQDKGSKECICDYLLNGKIGLKNPSPDFISSEYLFINPDAKIYGENPLIHYENNRVERRPISKKEIKPYISPKGSMIEKIFFEPRLSRSKKIVTILASFSKSGKISSHITYLLAKLNEISDFVILICDNQVQRGEVDKISSSCNVCICERHSEYDFGSYKRGLFFLQEQKILKPYDELIMMNDSNYGPISSFKFVLKLLHEQRKDFYGLCSNTRPSYHLQSFFYLFTPKVISSETFQNFFHGIKPQLTATLVVYNYELKLTKLLLDKGFSCISYLELFNVPLSIINNASYRSPYIIIKYLSYPMIKKKIFTSHNNLIYKLLQRSILNFVKNKNKKLFVVIEDDLSLSPDI